MTRFRAVAAEEHDELISIAEKGMDSFAEAEGFFLVNAIPWLRYLPSWLPGMGFKKIASNGYKNSMSMYQEPYERTKKKLVRMNDRAPHRTLDLSYFAARRNSHAFDDEQAFGSVSCK